MNIAAVDTCKGGASGGSAGLAVSLGLAICLLLPAAAELRAEPYRPQDDAAVIEELPGGAPEVSRELREARAAVAAQQGVLAPVLQLSRLYISQGRSESDPRFYGYAAALLEPWLATPEPESEVLVLDAVLHQANHDFTAALADLDRALLRNPRNAQATLTKAMIERAQGRYADAAEDCRQLDRRLPPLIIATCRAAAESLGGAVEASHVALATAYEAAAGEDAGLQLWSLTVLGEIAALQGATESAETHFLAGLALERRDIYLLASYADFLLDEGRDAAVLDLLRGETQVDPLLLRLAIAAARAGDSAADDYRRDLAARFAAARRRGDMRHQREEARFTLDLLQQPAEALALALANWQVQREPWDLRLVLEAARAAGNPEAAAPVLAWIEQSGFQAVWLADLRKALEARGS